MSPLEAWPVVTVLALGAWHGINPGMGWLFAVALGLQERERRAVWLALLPIAAGHALAVAAALAVAFLLGVLLPAGALQWITAAALVGTGASRLLRNRHPRYGGMRMTMRTLAVWSFLMATAHGAGLMVVPFALRAHDGNSALSEWPPSAEDRRGAVERFNAGRPVAGATIQTFSRHGTAQARPAGRHFAHAPDASPGQPRRAGRHFAHAPGASRGNRMAGVLVLVAHTLGFLLATGMAGVVVYERIGLRHLRRLWVNLDLVWGSALIVTGLLTPVIS